MSSCCRLSMQMAILDLVELWVSKALGNFLLAPLLLTIQARRCQMVATSAHLTTAPLSRLLLLLVRRLQEGLQITNLVLVVQEDSVHMAREVLEVTRLRVHSVEPAQAHLDSPQLPATPQHLQCLAQPALALVRRPLRSHRQVLHLLLLRQHIRQPLLATRHHQRRPAILRHHLTTLRHPLPMARRPLRAIRRLRQHSARLRRLRQRRLFTVQRLPCTARQAPCMVEVATSSLQHHPAILQRLRLTVRPVQLHRPVPHIRPQVPCTMLLLEALRLGFRLPPVHNTLRTVHNIHPLLRKRIETSLYHHMALMSVQCKSETTRKMDPLI